MPSSPADLESQARFSPATGRARLAVLADEVFEDLELNAIADTRANQKRIKVSLDQL